jgi:hypothetical protein
MKNIDNECINLIETVTYRKSFRTTRNKKPISFSIPKHTSFSWGK